MVSNMRPRGAETTTRRPDAATEPAEEAPERTNFTSDTRANIGQVSEEWALHRQQGMAQASAIRCELAPMLALAQAPCHAGSSLQRREHAHSLPAHCLRVFAVRRIRMVNGHFTSRHVS